ncbi:MAG: DUF3365 domain-containing protein [Desulfobacterales bacterium]|nr:DUF3365 domain-containing protein [Desulfobacterales bacterium]
MTQNQGRILKKIPVRRAAQLLLLTWTVLLGGSLVWNLLSSDRAILNQAISEANGHFAKDTVYRRWAALHGGVYVPVSENTPPSPYLAHIPERDISTPSGRRLTLMNPAYMTRQVQELSKEQYGVHGHITSLRPIRPGNAPDAWEEKALHGLTEWKSEASEVVAVDGVPYLRFMRPFFVEKGCLKCHVDGYKLGDLRGGISFFVPLDRYYSLRRAQCFTLAIWHFFLYIFGLAVIFLGARLLERTIRENETVAEELVISKEWIQSLFSLSLLHAKSDRDLIAFSLEEYIRLTGSRIGYFHFYDEASKTIKLFAWSKNVAEHCTIPAIDASYPLEKAGLWADCIRQCRPIIQNDYPTLPDRQGYPNGHFPITRYMSVPVMDGERIVGIAGVGNKEAPYDDEDMKQISLYMNNMMEIIKRKRAEDALARRQVELSLFRARIDHSYDAIFIISPVDGHFLDVNARACKMLGYTRKELLEIGVTDIDAVAAFPEEFSWERHIEELRHMPNLMLESVHKRKDGTMFPVEINIRLISMDDGEYMISVARDITERKASEKELQKHRENLERLVEERTETLTHKTADLERTQKALKYLLEDLNLKTDELEKANARLKELDQLKSMFIASMSHELRTPLNSIIGFTGVMLQGMSGEINDDQQDQLQRVYASGKHLLALITDVIDISKIEAKKTETFVSEFNLAEVISEAAVALQPEIEKKGLALEIIRSGALSLKTDRRRLLQCILNLLSNAVKYSEKGTIRVETNVHGELLDISVTDTGIGISEQDLPMLFQSFVRLESHLKIIVGGTGLGLYLTRKIANDLLGGTVSAQSSLGEGSRFVLTIPKWIDGKE